MSGKEGQSTIEKLPENSKNIQKAVKADELDINVEFKKKGILLLTFKDGSVLEVKAPPIKKREMSDTEYAALAATRLALNLAFTDERTGSDQAGYTVFQESDIKNLPGKREADPDAALRWACATLQQVQRSNGQRGWKMYEIAEFWINSNEAIKAGISLGTADNNQKEFAIKRLERALLLKTSGNSPKRKGRQNNTDW